jgi:AraC family transcriptional regulator
MIPRIEKLDDKKLIGRRQTMSLVSNKTGELWKSFMPRRRDISNKLTNDMISMQVYKPTHFADFKPTNEFEKWASVEVTNFDNVPNDMETFNLTGGLYAVFDYKGLSTDNSIFQFIFGTWLPSSEYDLDDRPHFEVLGNKYKNNDPTSEEEIWIPIKMK